MMVTPDSGLDALAYRDIPVATLYRLWPMREGTSALQTPRREDHEGSHDFIRLSRPSGLARHPLCIQSSFHNRVFSLIILDG